MSGNFHLQQVVWDYVKPLVPITIYNLFAFFCVQERGLRRAGFVDYWNIYEVGRLRRAITIIFRCYELFTLRRAGIFLF